MSKAKSKNKNGLGKSLMRNKSDFAMRHNNSTLHSQEIADGFDWGRLNANSITDDTTVEDFLRTAEMAGTEFLAEKLNIQYVNPKSNFGLLSPQEILDIQSKQRDKKSLLQIPRRPHWTKEMSAQELQTAENLSFIEWRRGLAQLQEEHNLLLTPYEKNLEFWRQLWRVIERSDVIIQIVDARNPLLFRNEDLEKYVKEIDENKMNMILVNKSDFLTEEQRRSWAKYFDDQNIRIVFFSAKAASEEDTILEEDENDEEKHDADSLIKEKLEDLVKKEIEIEKQFEKIEDHLRKVNLLPNDKIFNQVNVLSREEFIYFLKKVHTGSKVTAGLATIGFVGYPNVGKSSTINALMQSKKVSVSVTPGKTKHFQTLYVDQELMLCDCPGLVMPSFVLTKADMILNGILPIDQMKDHVPAVNQLCNLIPRHILEDTYNIFIVKPIDGEDPNRPPHSEELLLSYGYARGFMTANGQPDQARSARYILKDYVNGKLLYCYAPPNCIQEDFHKYPERIPTTITEEKLPSATQRAIRLNKVTHSSDLDVQFYQENSSKAGIKGRPLLIDSRNSLTSNANAISSKPWRQIKKHEKREKLRKKFAHLDQH